MADSAGTISITCSCLVRNPNPTNTPVRISQRHRPSSTAFISDQTAAIISRISSASGLSKRNISAATGVSASTAPARIPDRWPKYFRVIRYSSATDATPIRTSGTRIDHGLTPKIRALRPGIHSEAGGLSTVIEFAMSDDPKNHAFHDSEPAWTAAE